MKANKTNDTKHNKTKTHNTTKQPTKTSTQNRMTINKKKTFNKIRRRINTRTTIRIKIITYRRRRKIMIRILINSYSRRFIKRKRSRWRRIRKIKNMKIEKKKNIIIIRIKMNMMKITRSIQQCNSQHHVWNFDGLEVQELLAFIACSALFASHYSPRCIFSAPHVFSAFEIRLGEDRAHFNKSSSLG